jgi:hypothetical protein
MTQDTSKGAAKAQTPQQRDREDRRRVRVPPEPNMPDEVGEGTPPLDRMSAMREAREKSSDASGLAADDERRGEARKRRHDEGAEEVSEID